MLVTAFSYFTPTPNYPFRLPAASIVLTAYQVISKFMSQTGDSKFWIYFSDRSTRSVQVLSSVTILDVSGNTTQVCYFVY